MSEIKAIETYYNGYRFRSRLEARWAVFFDNVGIRYWYEPEGFEIKIADDTVIRYLPDFYLPDFGIYCEVKPDREHLMADSEKLSWMIDFHGPMENGLLILGQIPHVAFGDFPIFILYSWYKGIVGEAVTITDNQIVKTTMDLLGHEAPCCCAPDLEYPKGQEWKDLYFVRKNFPTWNNGLAWELNFREIPVFSYDRARQARFEHGETPTDK